MEDNQSPPLPELLNDIIDDATLACLFTDIETCTEVIQVSVKTRAMQMTPTHDRWTLNQACDLLTQRQAAGVQVRYRYQGDEWWDTIMPHPQGWRVVRIRQDFS